MGTILGQILPERTAAASGNTSLNFLFGGTDPRDRRLLRPLPLRGATAGAAAPRRDGNSAQIVPARQLPQHARSRSSRRAGRGSTSATACNDDTAGPGEHRGGLGIERIMEVGGDVITVSRAGRPCAGAPPWGLWGGGDGSHTRIELQRAGRARLPLVPGPLRPGQPVQVRQRPALEPGDRVRLVSPSGGGYGDPLERDPSARRRRRPGGLRRAASRRRGCTGSSSTRTARWTTAATERLRAAMRQRERRAR